MLRARKITAVQAGGFPGSCIGQCGRAATRYRVSTLIEFSVIAIVSFIWSEWLSGNVIRKSHLSNSLFLNRKSLTPANRVIVFSAIVKQGAT